MKKKILILLSLCVIVVVLAICAKHCFFNASAESDGDLDKISSNKEAIVDKANRSPKSNKKMRGLTSRKSKNEESLDDDDENPYDNISDEEMSSLSKEHCIILDALRNAFDKENKAQVLQIVRDIQKTKGWEDSTPKIIKEEALEALDWFGVDTLPEVVGFLADKDEEILESAIDRFESAVEDSDIKEIDRANILVMAAQVITDSEALESMFFELNSMENTIAVEAIKKLWVSANETAKALLPETIESVTGEDDITTPEKLDAWLLKNLDDQ